VWGILKNPHYTGKIVFNQTKLTPVLENGEILYKRQQQPDEDVIITEGKHPAIVDRDIWEAAQSRFASHPRITYDRPLKNPFSGVIYCSKCGRPMFLHSDPPVESRFVCRTRPRCFKATKQSEVVKAVVYTLEHDKLPELQLKVKNSNAEVVKNQQRLLDKFEKQMQEYTVQEENQYEMLETRKYSQELFDRRNTALHEKMELCQKQIDDIKLKMSKNLNCSEQLTALQTAITALKDPSLSAEKQNRAIKAIVERIDFTGEKSIGANQAGCIRNKSAFSVEVTLVT
jgi:formylmethanofuran dehydrogenase subunit E